MSGGYEKINSFEKGSSYRCGSFTVLNMYGTWREMGRQYGALASDILSETYKIAVEENILQGPYAPREAAEKAAGVVVLHKHGIDTVFVLQRPCRVTFGVVAPVILRPESTTR